MRRAPTLAECREMGATCACFNLRRAARSVTAHFNAHLAPSGLTATQFTILAVLRYVGRAAVGPLATRLGTEPSTLSRNLAVLRRRRMVGFTRSKGDGRVREAHVTATGTAALAVGYPLWQEAQRTIAAPIPPDDMAGVLRLLRRIGRTEAPRAPSGA